MYISMYINIWTKSIVQWNSVDTNRPDVLIGYSSRLTSEMDSVIIMASEIGVEANGFEQLSAKLCDDELNQIEINLGQAIYTFIYIYIYTCSMKLCWYERVCSQNSGTIRCMPLKSGTHTIAGTQGACHFHTFHPSLSLSLSLFSFSLLLSPSVSFSLFMSFYIFLSLALFVALSLFCGRGVSSLFIFLCVPLYLFPSFPKP